MNDQFPMTNVHARARIFAHWGVEHWSLRHWAFIGHWSLVIGHWSLVIGHWSLVIGHWSLVIGHSNAQRLQRLLRMHPIIKRHHGVFKFLVSFVAFAGDQHRISGLCFANDLL